MANIYFGYLYNDEGYHGDHIDLFGERVAQRFAEDHLQTSPHIMITDTLDCAAFETQNGQIVYDGLNAELPDKELIRVLYVRPDVEPMELYMLNDLKSFQEAVGGYIEVVPLGDGETLLVCNEEGKLQGLEPNRVVGNDIIMGNFVVCGQGCEDFAGLTNRQVSEWGDRFWEYGMEEPTGPGMQ